MELDFESLDNNELILLVTSGEKVEEVNQDLLKYYVNEKGAICIFTTFTKPHDVILGKLKKGKIRVEDIFFIDCATPISGPGEIHGTDKVVFCNPESLTNISIAITTAMKNMPKERDRILILDTVTTLTLYNKLNSVIKFIHFISGEIRKHKIKSLILSLDLKSNEKIISELSRFCDVTIRAG